jgi:hypothetical protein
LKHVLDCGRTGRDDPELGDLVVVVQEQVVEFAVGVQTVGYQVTLTSSRSAITWGCVASQLFSLEQLKGRKTRLITGCFEVPPPGVEPGSTA